MSSKRNLNLTKNEIKKILLDRIKTQEEAEKELAIHTIGSENYSLNQLRQIQEDWKRRGIIR